MAYRINLLHICMNLLCVQNRHSHIDRFTICMWVLIDQANEFIVIRFNALVCGLALRRSTEGVERVQGILSVDFTMVSERLLPCKP